MYILYIHNLTTVSVQILGICSGRSRAQTDVSNQYNKLFLKTFAIPSISVTPIGPPTEGADVLF